MYHLRRFDDVQWVQIHSKNFQVKIMDLVGINFQSIKTDVKRGTVKKISTEALRFPFVRLRLRGRKEKEITEQDSGLAATVSRGMFRLI